ncbi:MAG TPA: SAM-dependent methyltransferase [Pseudonocardiaceae bacterium]|nr:SAM-dependent methyltransferase [Pseudonocardiaceae bacterium]
MTLPEWVPDGIEITVPNAARAYDYALGGFHNFAVDREFVNRLEKLMPGIVEGGHATRAFVGRSVRWLVAQGIRQFLDIGSGIPTLGNVHEVAQAAAPESRVVYVDIDPIAVAHSKAMLADNPLAEVIRADLRDPGDILNHEDVLRLLDFSQPVAVLLNAVLHFVPRSADLPSKLDQIRDALVKGSYLTITHVTKLEDRSAELDNVAQMYEDTPTPATYRDRDEVRELVGDMEIVEPGIVDVTAWHPDSADDDEWPYVLAVVARK